MMSISPGDEGSQVGEPARPYAGPAGAAVAHPWEAISRAITALPVSPLARRSLYPDDPAVRILLYSVGRAGRAGTGSTVSSGSGTVGPPAWSINPPSTGIDLWQV